ncbi:LapA family protein [Fusibacter paucivorans]|uniref:LapA family protein n=1 Tax=Fusibacter paucivorans TaxID=76009 RepID=A0ABS5PT47_9FIRM|nr:LapA family protein [Fusibacter paucivorans]MBS7527731.1 LapA family protein [Fusibacter paucivorans]
MQANIILFLIFAIVIALFALFNATVVTVSFVFTQIEVSLALVIIISALIGALMVILFDSIKKLKTKKTIKELNKRITGLEGQLKDKELESLKKDEVIKSKDEVIKEKEDALQERETALKAMQEKNSQNGV